MTTNIDKAAERLLGAYAAGAPCEPVRDLIGTADDAYAVQDRLTERWPARPARRAPSSRA